MIYHGSILHQMEEVHGWREETKGHVKIGFPPPPPFFSQDHNHNLGSANHPQTLFLALLRLVKKDFLNYRTSFRKCKNNILRYGRAGCLNITYSGIFKSLTFTVFCLLSNRILMSTAPIICSLGQQ